MFNDFFLNFFAKKSNWLFADINTIFLTSSKSRTLWENYISYRHYCSEQLYLDSLINQSNYVATIKKKKFHKSIFDYMALGLTTDVLEKANLVDLPKYFRQKTSLEDSLIYQSQLNTQLLNTLDKHSFFYEKTQLLQKKTIRGMLLRWVIENVLPVISNYFVNLNMWFLIGLGVCEKLSFFFALPLIFYLFFNFLFTDALIYFQIEHVNYQQDISQILPEYFVTLFKQNFNFFFLEVGFNNILFFIMWFSFYFFFFRLIIFEDLSTFFPVEINQRGRFIGENVNNELVEYSNEYFLEICLFVLDNDFSKKMEFNLFSPTSAASRELDDIKIDLEHFFFIFLFSFFFLQYFINTGYWEVELGEDLDEFEDFFRIENDGFYTDVNESGTYSATTNQMIFSLNASDGEADTNYGFYEITQNIGDSYLNPTDSDYFFFSNFFSSFLPNTLAKSTNKWENFDVLVENKLIYSLLAYFSCDVLIILLFLFFILYLGFYIFCSWIIENYIFKTEYSLKHVNSVFYLGWQHALTHDKLKSDLVSFQRDYNKKEDFFLDESGLDLEVDQIEKFDQDNEDDDLSEDSKTHFIRPEPEDAFFTDDYRILANDLSDFYTQHNLTGNVLARPQLKEIFFSLQSAILQNGLLMQSLSLFEVNSLINLLSLPFKKISQSSGRLFLFILRVVFLVGLNEKEKASILTKIVSHKHLFNYIKNNENIALLTVEDVLSYKITFVDFLLLELFWANKQQNLTKYLDEFNFSQRHRFYLNIVTPLNQSVFIDFFDSETVLGDQFKTHSDWFDEQIFDYFYDNNNLKRAIINIKKKQLKQVSSKNIVFLNFLTYLDTLNDNVMKQSFFSDQPDFFKNALKAENIKETLLLQIPDPTILRADSESLNSEEGFFTEKDYYFIYMEKFTTQTNINYNSGKYVERELTEREEQAEMAGSTDIPDRIIWVPDTPEEIELAQKESVKSKGTEVIQSKYNELCFDILQTSLQQHNSKTIANSLKISPVNFLNNELKLSVDLHKFFSFFAFEFTSNGFSKMTGVETVEKENIYLESFFTDRKTSQRSQLTIKNQFFKLLYLYENQKNFFFLSFFNAQEYLTEKTDSFFASKFLGSNEYYSELSGSQSITVTGSVNDVILETWVESFENFEDDYLDDSEELFELDEAINDNAENGFLSITDLQVVHDNNEVENEWLERGSDSNKQSYFTGLPFFDIFYSGYPARVIKFSTGVEQLITPRLTYILFSENTQTSVEPIEYQEINEILMDMQFDTHLGRLRTLSLSSLLFPSVVNTVEYDSGLLEFDDDTLYLTEMFVRPVLKNFFTFFLNKNRLIENFWVDGFGVWAWANISLYDSTHNIKHGEVHSEEFLQGMTEDIVVDHYVNAFSIDFDDLFYKVEFPSYIIDTGRVVEHDVNNELANNLELFEMDARHSLLLREQVSNFFIIIVLFLEGVVLFSFYYIIFLLFFTEKIWSLNFEVLFSFTPATFYLNTYTNVQFFAQLFSLWTVEKIVSFFSFIFLRPTLEYPSWELFLLDEPDTTFIFPLSRIGKMRLFPDFAMITKYSSLVTNFFLTMDITTFKLLVDLLIVAKLNAINKLIFSSFFIKIDLLISSLLFFVLDSFFYVYGFHYISESNDLWTNFNSFLVALIKAFVSTSVFCFMVINQWLQSWWLSCLIASIFRMCAGLNIGSLIYDDSFNLLYAVQKQFCYVDNFLAVFRYSFFNEALTSFFWKFYLGCLKAMCFVEHIKHAIKGVLFLNCSEVVLFSLLLMKLFTYSFILIKLFNIIYYFYFFKLICLYVSFFFFKIISLIFVFYFVILFFSSFFFSSQLQYFTDLVDSDSASLYIAFENTTQAINPNFDVVYFGLIELFTVFDTVIQTDIISSLSSDIFFFLLY